MSPLDIFSCMVLSMSRDVGEENVASRAEVGACHMRTLSTSPASRRDGRRCAEKVSRFPVPSVGEASLPVAGQTFGPVQDGIHATGHFCLVVPGDRDQCVGHTKSSM